MMFGNASQLFSVVIRAKVINIHATIGLALLIFFQMGKFSDANKRFSHSWFTKKI